MSQEREMDGRMKKGSGYIEFSDEDPMDRAVLVGVHNVQTAMLKVERGLSWWQQEEVRIKREQQKQAGPHNQGTSGDPSHPRGPSPPSKRSRGLQERGRSRVRASPSKNTQSASGLKLDFRQQERGHSKAPPLNPEILRRPTWE